MPSIAEADWRAHVTTADRIRLRGWRSAWMTALDQARTAGHGGDLAADAALFDPDRMLADPLPPAGDYRCRVVKLGSRAGVGLGYVAYPAFRCRIDSEDGALHFAKLTGSQRPVGTIYTSEPTRGVFLGTVVLGDESRTIDYGRDTTRDMAGFVERIGTRRWRMVLPYPAFESTLDVIELVPAG
ncbi:DUF4893 domain-containing protein [Sphingomonas sp. EC-HK361]|uniref:DUF4893 domain-containing protein n=1 Tax=Sphingomonas sp. EC-HK361 TaxID=2038397 RepID=UPI001F3F4EF3|nr:DUF4893 domain-containing protein [Sphingomonas sp. EC-HK361]